MHFQSATVSQLLVQLDNSYQRYIRAEFTGFSYLGFNEQWQPIGGFIFGNACMLDIQNRKEGGYRFSSILYVSEDASESFEEQHQKMQNPDAVIFDRICDEVFGDG